MAPKTTGSKAYATKNAGALASTEMQLDVGAWMYAGTSDAGTSKLREILENTESDVRALREGIKKSAPKDGFLDEIAPLLTNAQAEQVALLRSETGGVVTQKQSLLANVQRAEARIKDLEAQRGVEAEALKSEQQRLSEVKEEASRARRERDRLKEEAQQHEALVVQIEGLKSKEQGLIDECESLEDKQRAFKADADREEKRRDELLLQNNGLAGQIEEEEAKKRSLVEARERISLDYDAIKGKLEQGNEALKGKLQLRCEGVEAKRQSEEKRVQGLSTNIGASTKKEAEMAGQIESLLEKVSNSEDMIWAWRRACEGMAKQQQEIETLTTPRVKELQTMVHMYKSRFEYCVRSMHRMEQDVSRALGAV